jgi:hypothetical protein
MRDESTSREFRALDQAELGLIQGGTLPTVSTIDVPLVDTQENVLVGYHKSWLCNGC